MTCLRGLDGEFDLLIAGGGIVGAGIARGAALRGLRVALFEKADFGGGTAAPAAQLLAGELGWSAARTAAEIDEYEAFVSRSRPRRNP